MDQMWSLGPLPLRPSGGACNVGLTAADEFMSDLEHLQKSNRMAPNSLYSAQKILPSITAVGFFSLGTLGSFEAPGTGRLESFAMAHK